MADEAISLSEADELQRLREENQRLRELASSAAASKGSRGRRVGSITCAVVGAIILPLSVITVWTRQTILNTDQYVQTVGPLANNEDIQEAVTFRVTEAVAEAVDFRALAEDTLPPEAEILAGPIGSGAKSLISEVVAGIVQSDAFADVWEGTHRVAHENVVAVLTGEGNDVVQTDGGRIALRIGPFAEKAVSELDLLLGTNLADNIPAEEFDQEFVLVESGDLADVQGALGLLDSLSWITVIAAIGLLLAAVLLAEKRRLGFRRVGIAIVTPMIIALAFYAWARGQYNDSLAPSVRNPDAAAAFFDITTRFLQRSFRAVLVLGLIFLIGAWLVGPSGSAAKVRAWWDKLLGRAGDAASESDVGPFPRWVATQQTTLTVGTAMAGVIVLALWTRPTGLVIILLVIAVLLVIGAIRVIAEVGRRAEAEPTALESTDLDTSNSPLEEDVVDETAR